jgi:hypothetical protein
MVGGGGNFLGVSYVYRYFNNFSNCGGDIFRCEILDETEKMREMRIVSVL